MQDAFFAALGFQLLEDRLDFVFQQRVVVRVAERAFFHLPLATEEGDRVDEVVDLRQIDVGHDARAPERRLRHAIRGKHGHIRAHRRVQHSDIAAAIPLGRLERVLLAALLGARLGDEFLRLRAFADAGFDLAFENLRLIRNDAVHRGEPLESILAVEDRSLVHLAECSLAVVACEGRAAEQHGHVHAERVQFVEVFLHHVHALDEQAGHADRVRLRLLPLLDDGRDSLLDSDIVNRVPVVAQDDVHEILSDVVDVSLHRREHDLPLALPLDLLHVRLEVRHRHLHDLRALKHERQLHLAGTEQLADGLHAVQQVVVDDEQRRVLQPRFLERLDDALLLAIDDVRAQPLFDGLGLLLLLRGRRAFGVLEELDER